MSVQNPDLSSPKSIDWDNEDKALGFGAYFATLERWWREIFLIAIIAAFTAGGVTLLLNLLQEESFEASAIVVVARSTSQVTLDDRFETTTDDTAAFRNATIEAARRASLVGLVDNSAIATAVIEELGDQLNEEEQSPAYLMEMVEATAVPGADNRTPSDLIRITVTADSPEKAANIANAWVDNYVATINAIYGQVPNEVLDALNTELQQTKAIYESAQAELEDFIATSQAPGLARQIQQYELLLTTLRQSQIDAATVVLQRDHGLRADLFNQLVDAETSPVLEMLGAQVRANIDTIRYLYSTRAQAAQFLDQAQALRSQIEQGGDAAASSNAVALQLLKTQVYAPVSTTMSSLPTDASAEGSDLPIMLLPSSMQWSLAGSAAAATASEQLRDVDALIASLQSYLAQLDETAAVINTSMQSAGNYQFLEDFNIDQFTIAGAVIDEEADSEDLLSSAIQASYSALFGAENEAAILEQMDSTANSGGLAQAINEAQQTVQQLAAQEEGQRSRERELIQQRDLAWNAYDTLNNKLVELTLERTAVNSEVRLGSTASQPLDPISQPSPLVRAIIGGLLGLLLGAMTALLLDYLGKEPFLSPRAA